MRTIPDHVPPELVRDIGLDFRGPMDELFPRLDALRAEGRTLWIETPRGQGRDEVGIATRGPLAFPVH